MNNSAKRITIQKDIFGYCGKCIENLLNHESAKFLEVTDFTKCEIGKLVVGAHFLRHDFKLNARFP